MNKYRVVVSGIALMVAMIICYRFGNLLFEPSRAETLPNGNSGTLAKSILQNNQDTGTVPDTPALIETPTGPARQYPVDPNIGDNDIRAIFENLGETSLIPLYSCTADSIIPYIASDNQRIQSEAIFALGLIGDTDTIPLLIELLSDSEWNTGNCALGSIDFIISRHHLRVADFPALHPPLVNYILERRWSVTTAINYLGRSENPDYIAPMKTVRTRAQTVIARGNDLNPLGIERYYACLQAMAKLGDQESRQEIIAKLHSPKPEERGRAAQCVGYVGTELMPYLLPLFDDRAQSISAGSAGSTQYYYRVCDLAATAVLKSYSLSFSSPVAIYYTDQQLADGKSWLTEHLAGQ